MDHDFLRHICRTASIWVLVALNVVVEDCHSLRALHAINAGPQFQTEVVITKINPHLAARQHLNDDSQNMGVRLTQLQEKLVNDDFQCDFPDFGRLLSAILNKGTGFSDRDFNG